MDDEVDFPSTRVHRSSEKALQVILRDIGKLWFPRWAARVVEARSAGEEGWPCLTYVKRSFAEQQPDLVVHIARVTCGMPDLPPAPFHTRERRLDEKGGPMSGPGPTAEGLYVERLVARICPLTAADALGLSPEDYRALESGRLVFVGEGDLARARAAFEAEYRRRCKVWPKMVGRAYPMPARRG